MAQRTYRNDEQTPRKNGTDLPLWRLIPLHDYKSPAEPTSETLRSTLRNLRSWLREASRQSTLEAPTGVAPKLRTVPPGLLTWVAPTPTWETAVGALDVALESWCAEVPQAAGIRSLVGAPYSNLADIAMQWGKAHNYAIIKPPTAAQILSNDPTWMNQWEHNKAARLILPHLERCYLRHHNGLDLIRRLLDWLRQTETPCLLVCDSWAWSYLKLVHRLDALCHRPLTLAPLDAYALDRWLFTLANRDRPDRFTFRQEKDGQSVLRYTAVTGKDGPQSTETVSPPQEKPSEFTRQVAARSRGVSGVAWAIWRYSLQIAADDDTDENVQKKAAQDKGINIWVTAWEELDLSDLPSGLSSEEAFVLHSLLLHHQVQEEILPLLLPCSSAVTMQALKRLQGTGIIQMGENGWSVAPLAYPAVRSYLRGEGYLVDEL